MIVFRLYRWKLGPNWRKPGLREVALPPLTEEDAYRWRGAHVGELPWLLYADLCADDGAPLSGTWSEPTGRREVGLVDLQGLPHDRVSKARGEIVDQVAPHPFALLPRLLLSSTSGVPR